MGRTLNDIMEFDHVIHVDWNGDVTEPRADAKGEHIYAPDVEFIDSNEPWSVSNPDVYLSDIRWEALSGFTGQYHYNGPIMHPSEFVGGGLEKYILSNPGYYVCCVVMDTEENEDGEIDDVGWVVLFREDDWHNPECEECVHECTNSSRLMGSGWCQICDDHYENAD